MEIQGWYGATRQRKWPSWKTVTKIDIVRRWIRWVLWWMCHVQICRIIYNDWHMRYTSWPARAWEECNMIYYASDCVFLVFWHAFTVIVLWCFPSIIEKLSWALNWFIENMGCLSMLNGDVGQQNTGNQPASAKTDAWYQHKSGTQMKQFIFWRSTEFYCILFF